MTMTTELPFAIIQKGVARLASVQALYRSDYDESKMSVDRLVEEVIAYYANEPETLDPDPAFLRELLTTFDDNVVEVDAILTEHLTKSWTMERIGPLLKSIVRLGITELKYFSDIPSNVIIHEYVSLTQAFFSVQEVGFVNAILDKIAKKLRETKTET